MELNKDLKKTRKESLLFGVLNQFIVASIILGVLVNFAWMYYKFTEFLHKNLTSDDTFTDWLIKDNYQIFIDGSFIVSLFISILSCFFALVLIWIFFRSSDDNLVINKGKILSHEEITEEDPIAEGIPEEEVEEEEDLLVEESPVEKIEEEESPVVEDPIVEEVKEEVIIQDKHEEDLTIEEIERDFERYNILFANRIYGKRVHRRKIMELERKVDKLKSLGKISAYYKLY